MKAISIRNISDGLYEDLREMAKKNHRSMQEQIRYLLALEIKTAKAPCLDSARKWRKKLADRHHSSTTQLIREDRER
ncbi:MAG: hypothetical protein PHS86_14250 [Syntrophaceae bacterium]|nr:hypothetical protein [Syntrophaceae bacterium]